MGGSTPKKPGGGGRKPRPDGAVGDGRDSCPTKFKTVISSPARSLAPGAWLEVSLDLTSTPPRVVLIDLTAGTIVGSLTGIPNLDVLIRCLGDGVAYRAYVESVVGGRVDVTVIQQ